MEVIPFTGSGEMGDAKTPFLPSKTISNQPSPYPTGGEITFKVTAELPPLFSSDHISKLTVVQTSQPHRWWTVPLTTMPS